MGAGPVRPLPGGYELRVAVEEDIEAIVALQVAAFGASDELNVRNFLTGPGARVDDWTVVTHGDAVVSSCGLFDVPTRLDGLRLPAGQVEYVATDPAHRRRGLIRAQFDFHHERSAARGHVVQFVGGIPYVYRRFGYGYGVSHPELFLITRDSLAPAAVTDAQVQVRRMTEDDLPVLRALEARRSLVGLTAARDDAYWRFHLALSAPWVSVTGATLDPSYHAVVVERAGEVVAWASFSADLEERKVWLDPTDSPDDAVTDALLAFGLDLAGDTMPFLALEQPGTSAGDRIRALGTPFPYGQGVYARIPDPVAFLDAIRPVLDARLAADARFAEAAGELVISLYVSAVTISYAGGRVTDVRETPGIEDPWDDDGCGVAPDWFPALVLGRWGARGLADRVDDVFLGHDAELLEVLFPRIRTDIVADF